MCQIKWSMINCNMKGTVSVFVCAGRERRQTQGYKRAGCFSVPTDERTAV